MPASIPTTPKAWWECYLQVPMAAGDEVSAFLHDLGSTAVVFHEPAVLAPQQDPCVIPTPREASQVVLQGAFEADAALSLCLARLQVYLHEQATVHAATPWLLYCRPLRDQAYLTQWRDFFQPMTIENRLRIRPPWDDAPVPDTLACLTLEPGMAFGTGTHPTTRLALTLLAKYVSRATPGRLLDVGCGSGILSLGALQLGVSSAIGVDIERDAVVVARQNAERNGLQDRVVFRQGSWQMAEGTYAVIAANIYLGPLVNMMHALAQRLQPDGMMVLSGILLFQEASLRTALDTAHLTVIDRLVEDNWVALAVKHQKVCAGSSS
jgi:ribosomal protein L11 methyltransferase